MSSDFPQVILELGNATIPFVQHLYPVFLKALSDEDDEVRGNATYGIGLIAANGGEAILPYPEYMLINILMDFGND